MHPTDRPIETIVRGVLRHDDRILICRNRKHGHLFLPGGHIDFGEPAKSALEREIREELGIELVAGRFLGACEAAFDQPTKSGGTKRHHEINIVFELALPHASDLDLSAVASQEHPIEFQWVPLSSITQPGSKVQLLPHGIAAILGSQKDPNAAWISSFE